MKTFEHLSEDELSSFQAQLGALIGADRAASLTWARRALLAPDGTWFIRYQAVEQELEPRFRDHPWCQPLSKPGIEPLTRNPADHAGMRTVAKAAPLAVAVDLLSGPNSPEAEVDRRAALFDEAVRQLDKRQEDAKRAEQEQRRQRAEHVAARPERWLALSDLERACYTLAEHKPITHRETFVALARLLGRPGSLRANIASTFEPPDEYR